MLAGRNEEVQLNLVISAKDEAKAVIDQFVTAASEAFTKLKEDLAKAFQIPTDALKSPIPPEMVTQIGTDVRNMSDDFKTLANSINTTSSDSVSAMERLTSEVSGARANIVEQTNAMVSQFEKLKASMESVGSTASTTGEKVSKSIDYASLQMGGMVIQDTGMKMVDALAKATEAAAEFDQNVVNTSASLNANLPAGIKLSTQQIDTMRNKMLDMGNTGFFSANQVAEAFNTLARQGIDYQTIMGGAAQTAHDVAVANQADLDTTASVISDIIHEMGGKGGELEHEFGSLQNQMTGVGDGITAALHHSRMSMDDFLNTMKYVGPQAAGVGVSFKDLSAEIALLGEHGIKSSQAGTTLRRELTNLLPQSKDAEAAMRALGLSSDQVASAFFDASGKILPMEQVQEKLHDTLGKLNPMMEQQATKAIFGQYALAGMSAITKTMPGEFKDLEDAMSKHGVTADIVSEKEKGWGFQVQALKAHFSTLQKEIGTYLLPVIAGLNDAMDYVSSLFRKLTPDMQRNIVVGAAIAGVVATLVGGLMVLVGTLGFVVTGMEALGGMFAVVFGPELLPIIAIIAAVVAGVVALYAAWKTNFGGIQTETTKIINYITPYLKAAWNTIVTDVGAAISAVIAWWNQMEPTFSKAVHNIIAALNWLSPLWKAVWAVVAFIVKDTWATIEEAIKSAWGVISGIFQFFGDLLAGNWKKLWGDIWQILSNAAKLVLDLLELSFVGKGLKLLGALKDGIIAVWKLLWNTVIDFLKSFAERIGTLIGDLVKAALKLFEDFGNEGEGLFVKAFRSFSVAIVDGAKAVMNFFTGMFDDIEKLFVNLAKNALDWGKNMIDMFYNGIMSGISKIENAVMSVANKVKSFLGMHSPAETGPLGPGESDKWMPNMMNMFAQGITDNVPKIETAVGTVALGIKTGVTSANTSIQQNISNTTLASPVNSRNAGVTVNINIEGRSMKTDQELINKLASVFRTQMSLVSG